MIAASTGDGSRSDEGIAPYAGATLGRPTSGRPYDLRAVEGVGPYYEEGVYEMNMASPKEKKR